MMVEKVFVSLGSNLGDRDSYLNAALKELAASDEVSVIALSRRIETSPVGLLDQPDFLNQVVLLETGLEAHELLDRLLAIEQALGRQRLERWGPRTIDLDILFFGSSKIDSARLKVPHPELVRRRFFLEMVEEISPGYLEQWPSLGGKNIESKEKE